MPKRVPITAAKKLAEEQGLRQVVVLAWDGDLAHVVSYGKTKSDCHQAAKSAAWVKKALTSPTPIPELPAADKLGAGEPPAGRTAADMFGGN